LHDGLAEILFYACIPLAFAAIFVVIVWVVQYIRRDKLSGHVQPLALHRIPLFVALLVMAIGLALTVHYSEVARRVVVEDARTRFLHQVEQVEADLQGQIADLEHLLDAVRGFLLAGPRQAGAEFPKFVGNMDLRRNFPGLRGLGYVERVTHSALPAFIARQRLDGRPSFAVAASTTQGEHYVTAYLEPVAGNEAAIGYDIAGEPVRRAAAQASMRSGNSSMSQRIQLVQDELKRPAVLILKPVFADDVTPQTEAERVRGLRGWVEAPVVLAELMAGGESFDIQQANFQLFDNPDYSPESLIYDSVFPSGEVHSKASLTRNQSSQFSVDRPILVLDQVFYLRVNSSPTFEASFHPREHLKAAVLGSGLSVLAAMVLWLLMAGRARAVELASSMTLDLDRLAMVARRTSNAVYFADTEWRINWVNEGFTRMSGFTPEDTLGRRPSLLLHSPLAHPDTAQTIDQRLEGGKPVNIQVLQRNKNGRDYWVDLEVLPIHDSEGRVTGYLSVQSDITEEVRAKAALLVEKERAENILSGTNVGTWERNLLTGEQRWNDRWGAMMGFTRDEVVPDVDQFWQQRLHPVDRQRVSQNMAECISGNNEGYSCDVRAQRKDGSWMWILSRAKVMSRTPDGRVEWIGGIHTDITEIKQVELNLREMEAFLDRAGSIAGVGAWQIDLRSRAVVFSAQTCAIHGMSPDFKPSEEVALSFYPPPDRSRLVEAMQCAERDGTPWDMVVEFNNAQGEHLWIRIFGEIGFDESGPARLVGAFQDVTKDRLAQIEVERSGALLRGAIEAINEAFVLYDPQDRLVFCNDKYRAIYPKSIDLMVPGATFESIIRAGAERGQYMDALGRVDAWVEERMAAHRVGNVDLEQHLDHGRWLKVIERRMPDGHTVGFRVDVTELKRATAAAESISARRGEEQRRMQTILEGTHVGTWEWNVQTGESLYNDQYLAMLGYTAEELHPLAYDTWVRLTHPDDLVACAQQMQEHLCGGRPDYDIELRMLHKLGHWIWVLAKGKLARRTPDGRPLWVYGTHMDITERKLAEQQLAQTMATLQNVLDSATAVGVITMDPDRTIRVFNRGAENLLGYGAEELVQLQSASIFFEPSELAALRETLELTWGREPGPQEVFEYVLSTREEQEWTLLRKDGSRFKASLIFSPMRDAEGGLVGNLAMLYDISKQKEYESSLREAMRLAEQSSVAKSQFLANMSHEIRTPMNAILGMLQLLRNTALNTYQRDYAEKASGAARSLLGLLNDILDFSKVEAGKMQLNPEPFLLEGLLGDLSVILSSNLGGKPVDLLFDVDPALPVEVVGDAMRLKQILINLGGNAVKFTERGQVVIRWKLLARTHERVKVGVEVVDTGIGIAPENQARIFKAFTQAEANTTRRFGGTGLGLVISTRLIRLMGGELQLSSGLGQGSTFSFTIELAVPAYAPPAPAPVAALSTVRALLVDDNAHALATSAAMMRSLGWEVTEVASGAQAVALVRARLEAREPALDALFVDWDMPDMDGWETLRNMRRLYGSQKAPLLILLSRQSRDALAERTDREQALLDGLMVKPLTATMFTQVLAQAREGTAQVQTGHVAQPCRLAGMRVLLVEDNAINQQVAKELLSAEGATVSVAENGALGVEAVRVAQPGFDVVLMDLQMPVMDGLTATRLLRADARFADLPVIAMTANAMGSDRDECLAVGMNDHIGKPFDLNALVKTLIQQTDWIARGGVAPVQVALPDTTSVQQDWPAEIDVVSALKRMGNNRGLLQRSLVAFATQARDLPQRLESGLHSTDRVPVQRELHAFKGLSATVGVQELSDLAAQAEKLIQTADVEEEYRAAVALLEARLTQLLPVLDRVAAQLAAPVSPLASGPLPVAVDGEYLLHLKTLLQALQASDMDAMELHARLRQSINASLVQSMEALDAAMADLEFEQASIECGKLICQFETI
jgi:PAS domain S-box-containing protein